MRTIRRNRTICDRPPAATASADAEAVVGRILASFERLAEVASETHTDDLLAMDITMQQAKALHLLAAAPGIGVTALASRLGVGLSTVSGIVDRLAEMDLLERRQDDEDRRHVMLTLTDEGRAVVDRFRDVGVGILRQHLPHLRPAELAGLQTGLDGLVRVMGARTLRQQPIEAEGAHATP